MSVGGNLYSVPDATRRLPVEVHTLAEEIRIVEDGELIASHPVLEGRHQRRVAPGHRKLGAAARHRCEGGGGVRTGDAVAQRSLDFYDAVGRQLAQGGRA